MKKNIEVYSRTAALLFQLSEKDLRPVLVWIHGGAFFGGDGTELMMGGPQYLIEQDIVVVTINYRVGPLGNSDLQDLCHKSGRIRL